MIENFGLKRLVKSVEEGDIYDEFSSKSRQGTDFFICLKQVDALLLLVSLDFDMETLPCFYVLTLHYEL